MTLSNAAVMSPAFHMVTEEDMNDLVTIAVIGRPHGLAGDLKVRPVVDAPDRFVGRLNVILEGKDGRRVRFTIRRVRSQNAWRIVSFHEMTSIEQASFWVGGEVKIARDALELLPDGEYYHFDLVGMEVFTEGGLCIGMIEDIFQTGSNDVFVVKHQETEHLIPGTEEIVRYVDVARKRMVIRPIEGLLAHDAV